MVRKGTQMERGAVYSSIKDYDGTVFPVKLDDEKNLLIPLEMPFKNIIYVKIDRELIREMMKGVENDMP